MRRCFTANTRPVQSENLETDGHHPQLNISSSSSSVNDCESLLNDLFGESPVVLV